MLKGSWFTDRGIGTLPLPASAAKDTILRATGLIEHEGIPDQSKLDQMFASRTVYDRFVREPRIRAFGAELYSHRAIVWGERRGAALPS